MVNKIAVTKICEKSGISRTTFYRYYLDVRDLLNQIESELVHEMNVFNVNAVKGDLEQSIVHILSAIWMHGDQFFLLTSDYGNYNYIKDVLKKWYDTSVK